MLISRRNHRSALEVNFERSRRNHANAGRIADRVGHRCHTKRSVGLLCAHRLCLLAGFQLRLKYSEIAA